MIGYEIKHSDVGVFLLGKYFLEKISSGLSGFKWSLHSLIDFSWKRELLLSYEPLSHITLVLKQQRYVVNSSHEYLKGFGLPMDPWSASGHGPSRSDSRQENYGQTLNKMLELHIL